METIGPADGFSIAKFPLWEPAGLRFPIHGRWPAARRSVAAAAAPAYAPGRIYSQDCPKSSLSNRQTALMELEAWFNQDMVTSNVFALQTPRKASVNEIDLCSQKPSTSHMVMRKLRRSQQQIDIIPIVRFFCRSRLTDQDWPTASVRQTSRSSGSAPSSNQVVDLEPHDAHKQQQEPLIDVLDMKILKSVSTLWQKLTPGHGFSQLFVGSWILVHMPSWNGTDVEDEPPLFASIRRLHLQDASHPAENIVTAIKKLRSSQSSLERPCGTQSVSTQACDVTQSTSNVPGDQNSPTQDSSNHSGNDQAREAPFQKRKRTSRRQSSDDNRDEGSDKDEDDENGPKRQRRSSLQSQKAKQKKSWKCPYGVLYPDINSLTFFKSCRRHGIKGRDQFWSHLEQKHYKQSSNRPTSDYRMNQNQKSQLEALIKNIPRVLQQTHNNNFQEYEKAQFYNDLKAYRSVWAIIFPENIHRCPNIPYYLDFGTDERERISGQIYDAILNEEKSVQRRAGYLSWQPNDDENKKLAVQLVSMVLDSDPAAAQRLASICHSETAFYREQASIEPHQHHSTANSAQAQSLVTDAGASVDLDSVASPLSATVDLDPDVESHHLQAQPFLDPQQEQTGPAQKPSFALDTYGGNLTMIPFSTNVELFRDQVCNTIIVSLTCGQVSISTASCMAELSLLLPLGYNVQIMYPTRHEAQFPADLAPFTPKFNFNDHMSIASDEDPTKIPFSTKVRLYRNQEYNTIIIHLICGQMSTSAAACMAELSMLLPLGFNVHIIYPTKHAAQFPADLAPFTPDFNFNDDMSIASDHMLPQQQQFYENNFNAGPSGVE